MNSNIEQGQSGSNSKNMKHFYFWHLLEFILYRITLSLPLSLSFFHYEFKWILFFFVEPFLYGVVLSCMYARHAHTHTFEQKDTLLWINKWIVHFSKLLTCRTFSMHIFKMFGEQGVAGTTKKKRKMERRCESKAKQKQKWNEHIHIWIEWNEEKRNVENSCQNKFFMCAQCHLWWHDSTEYIDCV